MKTTTTTEFQLVDINKLIPYVNNARTHSPEQINKLRSSLREFGFVNPLIIDKDYNILCGHGRVKAAQAEGYEKVPCIFVEHMTEAQKKAYIIADNRMALDAGWDNELLEVELEALKGMDFDLSLTGFDPSELDKLLSPDVGDIEEDDFDVDEELEKPVFSKPGDIWTLERHKVICGDSTLPETFEKLLGDIKVNLVCTDSPYFISLKNKSGTIQNDDLNDKEAYEFLMKCFTNFKSSMAIDASIYEFYSTMKTRVFYDAFEDAGFKVGAGLIWKKPRTPFMRTDWKFNMEPIIFGWRKDGKHKWYGDQKQTAIFEFDSIKDSETEGCGHPSSKPVPLIAYLIKQCTTQNAAVLDGFLGSASTLIACDKLDHICYGVEFEPKFVDVAVKRYATLKGETKDIHLLRDGKEYTYDEIVSKEESA